MPSASGVRTSVRNFLTSSSHVVPLACRSRPWRGARVRRVGRALSVLVGIRSSPQRLREGLSARCGTGPWRCLWGANAGDRRQNRPTQAAASFLGFLSKQPPFWLAVTGELRRHVRLIKRYGPKQRSRFRPLRILDPARVMHAPARHLASANGKTLQIAGFPLAGPKPDSVEGDHPSRPGVTSRLERCTRSLGGPRHRDLLHLAPDGV